MTYTFLHCGVVMGESDLSAKSRRRGQKAGAFRPTAYGRTLLPRVTCILSASMALKNQLATLRRSASNLSQDEFERLLYDSEAGRAMIDVGRVLSDVELRGPDGHLLEFASIAFSDVNEIRRLGRELITNFDDELKDLPPDAPKFIVSVTLGRARFSAAVSDPPLVVAPARRYEN